MRTVIASLICLPLVACVDDTETETTSTTTSELCTDGAADVTVAFKDKDGMSAATSEIPTSNFDRPACADRFTVDITGVSQATQPFHILGDWSEAMPTSEDQCTLAFANVQAQEYRATFNCSGGFCFPVYGWQNVGSDILMHGEWLPGPWANTHHCELVPATPLPTLQPNVFRSKVRVSVRAYAWALFFPAYKRALAGVWSPYVIQ